MSDLTRHKPTQREVVLEMLEKRGERGVHSFEFIQVQIPRVAARVCELRAEGYEITSEHEALHGTAEGVRYKLANAGVGAGGEAPEGANATVEATSVAASLHSGVEDSEARHAALPGVSESPPARSVPSMFDVDDCLTWNQEAA